MKELLEFIVKGIVAKSEGVFVGEEKDDSGIILKLKVDDADFGSVIGRNGRMVRSIRDLLRIKAQRESIKYNFLIEEPKPEIHS